MKIKSLFESSFTRKKDNFKKSSAADTSSRVNQNYREAFDFTNFTYDSLSEDFRNEHSIGNEYSYYCWLKTVINDYLNNPSSIDQTVAAHLKQNISLLAPNEAETGSDVRSFYIASDEKKRLQPLMFFVKKRIDELNKEIYGEPAYKKIEEDEEIQQARREFDDFLDGLFSNIYQFKGINIDDKYKQKIEEYIKNKKKNSDPRSMVLPKTRAGDNKKYVEKTEINLFEEDNLQQSSVSPSFEVDWEDQRTSMGSIPNEEVPVEFVIQMIAVLDQAKTALDAIKNQTQNNDSSYNYLIQKFNNAIKSNWLPIVMNGIKCEQPFPREDRVDYLLKIIEIYKKNIAANPNNFWLRKIYNLNTKEVRQPF